VKAQGNGKNKILISLMTCLVLCLLIVAGCFLISRQAKKITALAVRQTADILTASTLTEESIKNMGSMELNSPLTLAFFTKDLKWMAGTETRLDNDLRRDIKFAIKSGLRVRNQKRGYEIVPKGQVVTLVMANPDFLSALAREDWIMWTGAVLILILITFSAAYNLLRPGRGLSECCSFLQEVTGAIDNTDLDELIYRARNRIEDLLDEIETSEEDRNRLREEVKRLRRSLRKTTQDLEATQEHLLRAGTLSALGEFAAGISHELNNPMGIVLGFTQHLLDEVPPDHPHYPKLKRMEIELGRCQRILQDLLAFARPLEPVFRRVDINRLVRETLQFVFYPGIEGIEVICNLEEDLPEIEVDPDQLEQILINLLKNGVQAIEKQGKIIVSTSSISLSREDTVMLTAPVIQPGALLMEDPGSALSLRVPRVEGSVKPGDPAIKIEITDTGCGINPQDFKKIFTPFYTTKKDGTGLGLSICWKLVRRNRGILKVHSAMENGSTFIIIFPVNEDMEENLDHDS